MEILDNDVEISDVMAGNPNIDDLLAPDYESPNDDNDLIVKVIMRIVKTLPQKKVLVNLVTKISELELKVLV